MIAMNDRKTTSIRPLLLLLGSLGTILAVAVAMAVGAMSGTGQAGMSGHGWAAMAHGIVFSLALGGGLMALVFFSARNGYDDAAASGEHGDEGR